MCSLADSLLLVSKPYWVPMLSISNVLCLLPCVFLGVCCSTVLPAFSGTRKRGLQSRLFLGLHHPSSCPAQRPGLFKSTLCSCTCYNNPCLQLVLRCCLVVMFWRHLLHLPVFLPLSMFPREQLCLTRYCCCEFSDACSLMPSQQLRTSSSRVMPLLRSPCLLFSRD